MAQEAICIHDPSESIAEYAHAMTEGAKQSLPAGARQLGNVEHNLGDDGETPGPAITIIDRLALTRINPNWMNATGDYVEHYVYDQRNKGTWYAYPRPEDPWYVHLWCPVPPTPVSAANIDHATNGRITVGDIWRAAIHDFTVGYAILKNFRGTNYNKAAFHLDRFERTTGIELKRKGEYAPLDQIAAEAVPDAEGRP